MCGRFTRCQRAGKCTVAAVQKDHCDEDDDGSSENVVVVVVAVMSWGSYAERVHDDDDGATR